MIVAEWIARFLAVQGVRHVYTVSGGMICPMLDAIDEINDRLGPYPAPRIVPMRHEQAAGFAAEGMARMTGVPGVAMATSGPGATNLLTAIASCYFDSTPAVFITGQVPTNEMRVGHERQRGFQETDICAMATPVTKAVRRSTDAEWALRNLIGAFRTALTGRPGPVLIDIPFDVQRAEIEDGAAAYYPFEPVVLPTRPEVYVGDVSAVLDALRASVQPLVLVGGGCAAPRVRESVRSFKCLNLPVVHSLMGKDVLPTGHPLNVGFIGTYGNRWANMALARCDTLLVLGSRLDVRQLGSDAGRTLVGKRVFQVDVDSAEAGRVLPQGIAHDNRALCCDLFDFSNSMRAAIVLRGPIERQVWRAGQGKGPWRDQIAAWRRAWPDTSEQTVANVHPNAFMHQLADRIAAAPPAAVVCDVGAHQMWAAQSLRLPEGTRFLTSGGHGAMGWGLPAAVGACLAENRPIVCITGDGGLQMNVQELATIAELGLSVKIVVLDNGGHAMVRQFQDQLFGGRHVATDAPRIDFDGIAHAYGLPSITSAYTAAEKLDWLFSGPGPALVTIPIDPSATALPKVAFGRGLDDMEPKRVRE